MAKHRFTRAPKINYAGAALGATVLLTAFGGHTAALADTLQTGAQHTAGIAGHDVHAENASAQRAETAVTATATQVLALARQQIGTSENAQGGGTKFQEWYASSPRAAETVRRDGGAPRDYLNAAWCSMFVSWVGEHSGARSQVGWDAYTVTHAKWFKANGRWGSTPKPGAVVFFAWDGSKDLDSIQHVGFVEKDNGDGTITTIEGNTGNGKVEERVRPTSQVVGYGYPHYAA
ncbi:CHAP domain-containing protein [Nonomuraea pusilla]|uniref:CHAP domain-containing protein n=1 Tax=Nonomuraea pusilla TaxID=46177 RepID=UPI003333076C